MLDDVVPVEHQVNNLGIRRRQQRQVLRHGLSLVVVVDVVVLLVLPPFAHHKILVVLVAGQIRLEVHDGQEVVEADLLVVALWARSPVGYFEVGAGAAGAVGVVVTDCSSEITHFASTRRFSGDVRIKPMAHNAAGRTDSADLDPLAPPARVAVKDGKRGPPDLALLGQPDGAFDC